jgi:hypothetical protein
MTVWRHVSGLDGREICSYNMRGRELLGEFDGPDSGSGGEVKHVVQSAFEIFNWREIEGFEGQGTEVVLEIQSVFLDLDHV